MHLGKRYRQVSDAQYAWRIFNWHYGFTAAYGGSLGSMARVWSWPTATVTAHHTGQLHRAPRSHCTCGLYGTYLPPLSLFSFPAVGLVRCHGKTIIHEEGLRSQHMTICWLGISEQLADLVGTGYIRERYGVPVQVMVESPKRQRHVTHINLASRCPDDIEYFDFEVRANATLHDAYCESVLSSDGLLPPWETVAFAAPPAALVPLAQRLTRMAKRHHVSKLRAYHQYAPRPARTAKDPS